MKKAERLLIGAGLKKTRPRLEILSILCRAKKSLSHDQIRRKFQNSAYNPDKVTIYRCLEKFVKCGLVHLAYIQDRISYYELGERCSKKQCHPHFTCVRCGKTSCMEDVSVPMAKGLSKGFKLHRQQVRLEGLCPNCR